MDFVSQIIFPVGEFENIKSRAYLIGWNLDNFRCCVACAIEAESFDVLSAIVEKSKYELGVKYSSCSKYCTIGPTILGEYVYSADHEQVPAVEKQSLSIWITLTSNHGSPHPRLHSLYSLGCEYKTSCYLIQYTKINSENLEFLHVDKFVSDNSMRLSELDYVVSQINVSHELSQLMKLRISESISSSTSLFQYNFRYVKIIMESIRNLTMVSCLVVVQHE